MICIIGEDVFYAIAKDRIAVNPMSGAFIRRHALPSASSVQSALQKLMKSGLITKSEGGIQPYGPLLRIFINDMYSTPEI